MKLINKNIWYKAQGAELDTMLNSTTELELTNGHRRFLKAIKRKIDFNKFNDLLLDVCCGPVSILTLLPEAKLKVAVDSNLDKYLEKFPRSNNIEYKNMKAESLEFPNEFFDKVFCLNAIDHTFDFRKVLNELFRVTKKGGLIFISLENLNYIYKLFYKLGVKKLNQIYHPYTICCRDIKNEIIKNIDSRAKFLVVPIYEKLTLKNVLDLFKIKVGKKLKKLYSSRGLPFFSKFVHYFIIFFNRFFSFFYPENHAYFVGLIIEKSDK